MQRISSRMTFCYKRVFPIVCVGWFVAFVSFPYALGSAPPEFLIIPLAILVVGIFLMKKLAFDMADEVLDAGDALIVRNRNQEDRIPLSSIMNVSYSPWISPSRVTLTLRTPSKFGDKVVFCGPVGLLPFVDSPIEDLIGRIDAARRRAR
jgi:hypothetical protein